MSDILKKALSIFTVLFLTSSISFAQCGDFHVDFDISPASSDIACDASVTTSITAGTAPFSYEWNTGVTTANLNDICIGTYTITVIDANECFFSDSVSVFSVCEYLEIVISKDDASSHLDCDGEASLSITGGSPPYDIMWSTGSIDADIYELCPGAYSVTVTDDNDCIKTIYFNIGPDAPDPCEGFSISTGSVAATSPLICDGEAEVIISGGSEPYTISWSSGGNNLVETDLCPGEYDVLVEDDMGCIATDSVHINNSCPDIIVNTTVTNASSHVDCNGSVETSVSGGEAPYTYEWSNGITTPNMTDICPGNYNLTVTDNNLCAVIIMVYVGPEPPDPCLGFSVSIESEDASNDTECDGSAHAVVSGGTPPYSFLWSTGETSSEIEDLCVGAYTIYVEDSNACYYEDSIWIGDGITPSPFFSGYAIPFDETEVHACDGYVELMIFGGIPPFSYEYSTGHTTELLTDLCTGLYEVTVTDSDSNLLIISFLISNPEYLIIGDTYTDSTSIGTISTDPIENCDIDFDEIINIEITNVEIISDEYISVEWTIYTADENIIITQEYYISGESGVYTVILSLYCTAKNISAFIKAEDRIYFNPDDVTQVERRNILIADIYPNPFRDMITVSTIRIDDYKIIVTDITGKVVIKEDYFSTNSISIKTSGLRAGKYIVNISSKNAAASVNVIKL